jgi:hypothetical protein
VYARVINVFRLNGHQNMHIIVLFRSFCDAFVCIRTVAYPGIFSVVEGGLLQDFFFGGRVQQIQLRAEGRENGELRAVAPNQGVPLNLPMSETRILTRLLRMYFLRNWEFGSVLSKLRNFRGGGVEPPSVRHCIRMKLGL